MDYKDFWVQIITELQTSISRPLLLTYFKNTAILGLSEEGVLIFGLPREFFLSWQIDHAQAKILRIAKKKNPVIQSVVFQINGALEDPDNDAVIDIVPLLKSGVKARKLPKKQEVKLAHGITSRIFNPKYSLQNYIYGGQNRLAHAACSAVAKHPGAKYNPLFLYGGVGLGKTHLLQATGSEILRNDPEKMVVYVTSETFTNEVVESIKKQKMDQVRRKYRKVDALIIDDIQFLFNKERTQEEFFHTFNTLYEAGKQIIISSDRPPKELKILEERLRSRCEWGMTVDVKFPEYETRLAILEEKAKEYQILLPREIFEFIAFNVQNSIRELEGVLMQMVAQFELEKKSPTVQSVAEIMRKLNRDVKLVGFEEKQETLIVKTMDELIDVVSNYFSLPKSEILGPKRTKELMIPRQITMYLAKTYLNQSLQSIGDFFGGRDHTSVLHSVKKLTKDLAVEPQLERDVNTLKHEMGV